MLDMFADNGLGRETVVVVPSLDEAAGLCMQV